jgi:urease accessory protein
MGMGTITHMSMGRTSTATMTDLSERALLRLMTWLSPAFPVGAFSYSHGIERAVEEGLIGNRESLVAWLDELLVRGSAWNDAVLLAESWRRGKSGDVGEISELAGAMAGSKERHMETMLQGVAFQQALAVWSSEQSPDAIDGVPYAVAVGNAAARHDIALEPALTAYLHAFISNLVQAAVRIIPLGQGDGISALAALEEAVLATAALAATSTLDDLGSAAFMSEIMTMRHETQYSRVFRS